MEKLNHWVRRLTGIMADDIPVKGLGWLFRPGVHVHLLSARRAELILSRTRTIAALFAILTSGWIVIDFAFLPADSATLLAIGRVIASLIFAGLTVSFRGSNSMKHAYIALVILFAAPTAFYLFSFQILAGQDTNQFAIAMLSIYSILPVVAVAGISIFPLTALEAFIFALPVLIIQVVAAYFNIHLINIDTQIGAFWLLLMVVMVACISGVSQLGFMVSLMGQAMRDPLTKCFSRLSAEELLELQFIISVRNQAPLSLAFIDLDHFKSINDTFGHEAGDKVLNASAMMIRSMLRNGDMLGRWGGEEFILIFPNTTIEQAMQAIKRMRLQGLGSRPDGQPVTASIGLAERVTDQKDDWKALIDLADKRMYVAKTSGRNRVVDNAHITENIDTGNYRANPSSHTA